MAKQKIKCAKGVRLTAEQRAKLEGFRAKREVLSDRLDQLCEKYEQAMDKIQSIETTYLHAQGFVYNVDDNWNDVVVRAESEED